MALCSVAACSIYLSLYLSQTPSGANEKVSGLFWNQGSFSYYCSRKINWPRPCFLPEPDTHLHQNLFTTWFLLESSWNDLGQEGLHTLLFLFHIQHYLFFFRLYYDLGHTLSQSTIRLCQSTIKLSQVKITLSQSTITHLHLVNRIVHTLLCVLVCSLYPKIKCP